MGIKSTYTITRHTAMRVLGIGIPSDTELENLLEDLPESHFRNYIITDSDDVENKNMHISDINDFKTR